MAITIRPATEGDLEAMYDHDQRVFGYAIADEDDGSRWRKVIDLSRFRLAHDGSELVGVAGVLGKELTLPGDAPARMGGLTWVAVSPTHRRQGLLTRLMAEVHDDIESHEEPLAGLLASEGGIYERFGYGVATTLRSVVIDTRHAQLLPQFEPPAGTVQLITPRDRIDDLTALYDRYRRHRVGEIARDQAWMELRLGEYGKHVHGAIHEDGYVIWTVKDDWNEGLPQHDLEIRDFVASTPEAFVALWHLVFSLDLIGTIRTRTVVSIDDPLPSMLTNPRAVCTVALNDLLWLRPQRVGEALAARRYRVEDEFVLAVTDPDHTTERWVVQGDVERAKSEETDRDADLTMSRAALGSLLLGATSASALARTQRLRGSPAALRRADAFFGWSPVAHCATGF